MIYYRRYGMLQVERMPCVSWNDVASTADRFIWTCFFGPMSVFDAQTLNVDPSRGPTSDGGELESWPIRKFKN